MPPFPSNPPDFLDALNPAQREAVETTEGPLLVVAGAGSGKTRVITYRIANLIARRGVAPYQILAVTFTNKAAGEMRNRVLSLLGLPPDTLLPIGTFHSRCAAILRREAVKVGLSERYQILDEDDQKAVMRELLKRLEIPTKKVQPHQALEVISLAKNNLQGPEGLKEVEEFDGLPYAQIYQAYQDYLTQNDAVDFDDLLLKVVQLFELDLQSLSYWRRRYQYVLVDEYQDTNPVQFRLLQLLAGEHRNLCVVGDEDQSIYSWRGADIANLLDFQKVFPEAKIIRLEQNYRSTQRILQCANAVIRNNKQRFGKTLFTENEEGPPIQFHAALDGREEGTWVAERIQRLHILEGIPYRELAVFYRINSLSRAIEDAMRYARIPYRVVGSIRFYERKEIRDLLSYLRLAVNPGNDLALQRVVNVPPRGIGAVTLDKLRQLAHRESLSLYAAARRALQEEVIRGRAVDELSRFLDKIDHWQRVRSDAKPSDLLKLILQDTNYSDELGDPHSLDAITRNENIDELGNTLAEWSRENQEGRIDDWLEQIALTTSSDTAEGTQEGVSLMTLHCAKGLEFDAVFLIGMEGGLFPLTRSVDEQGDAEEERRLFYVGMMRARKWLTVTHARSRMIYGEDNLTFPSEFLFEMPPELFEDHKGPRKGRRQ